jgi:hypothetical protein
MQDILNAVAAAGLRFVHLDEMNDNPRIGHFWFYENERTNMSLKEIGAYYDWKVNPYAALPQWFSFKACK